MIETFIYVIIAIIILFYIIDKKELLPPNKIEPPTIQGEIKKTETIEEIKKEVYKNIYTSLKEINPLKTYRSWTYIEIPNKEVNIQLSYDKMNIPEYFQECIRLMKKNIPELIVLTPLNISDYLPNFPIVMKNTSNIPLKLRIDILFAHILDEYGGLCISPGTIVYNVNKALGMLKKYEIVTFGATSKVLQSDNNLYYPNSYVLGSQKNTPFIQEYKRLLLLSVKDTYLYNFKSIDETDILSHLVITLNPTQFHFGTEYDGTYDSRLRKISLSTYMGTYEIDFQNKDKLLLVSFPYDLLFKNNSYDWFLNLSKEQFVNSNLELKNLLRMGI
tara:strand:- start:1507 stop:2499 length:993 start_codon:yes stop_codon:yes gene_type:complete